MEKTKKKRQRRSVKQYFKELFAYCGNRCKGSASNIAFAVIMALYMAFCIGGFIHFAIASAKHIEHLRDCGIAVSYIAIAIVIFLAEFNLHLRSPLPYTIFVLVFSTFCFLGASFNFYTLIPFLDDILHACWGILFSSLGFAIVKSLMGEPKNLKQFIAYLIFAVGFCMLISILWEVYEFASDNLSHNFDMQEDTIIHHFHSFRLYPGYDHLHTLEVDGIAKTILYDKDGNVLLELDGYLDIGLYDTMWDILWCLFTTVALTVVLSVDRALGGKIYPHIIPVYVGKDKAEAALSEESEAGKEVQEGEQEEGGKQAEDGEQSEAEGKPEEDAADKVEDGQN